MFSNSTPPSTLAHLARFYSDQPLAGRLNYLKPKPGIDLNILHTNELMAELRIVQLSVMGMTCVPFHRHEKKEKMYVVTPPHNGNPVVEVMLGVINPETGFMKVHSMNTIGQTFVIPKNHWHTLWVPSNSPAQTQLIVVSSSQDGSDIEWTPQGDLLVELSCLTDCNEESPLNLPFLELEKHLVERLVA